MADQEYGPTPPQLLRFPDGSELPTAPDGGSLKTYDSERQGLAMFSDAVAHDLAVLPISADRTMNVEVSVEAYDPAGAVRVANGYAILRVSRKGNAAPVIAGTPVMLDYDPNAAPWNTITADLVVPAASNNVAVRVTGLGNTPIRWRAEIRVMGAQARQVS